MVENKPQRRASQQAPSARYSDSHSTNQLHGVAPPSGSRTQLQQPSPSSNVPASKSAKIASKTTKLASKTTKLTSNKKKSITPPSKRRPSLPPVVKASPSRHKIPSPSAKQQRRRKPHPDEVLTPNSSQPPHSFPDFADGTNVLDGLNPFLQERVLEAVGSAGLANFRSDELSSSLDPVDSPFDFPRSVGQGGSSSGNVPAPANDPTATQYEHLLAAAPSAAQNWELEESRGQWPWPAAPLNAVGSNDALQPAQPVENAGVDYNGVPGSSPFMEAIPPPRRAHPRVARLNTELNGAESLKSDNHPIYEAVVRGRHHVRYDDNGEPLEYVEPLHFGLLGATVSDSDPSDGDFVADTNVTSNSELSSDSVLSVEAGRKQRGQPHANARGNLRPPRPEQHPLEHRRWPLGPSRLVSPHTSSASLGMAARLSADRLAARDGMVHPILAPTALCELEIGDDTAGSQGSEDETAGLDVKEESMESDVESDSSGEEVPELEDGEPEEKASEEGELEEDESEEDESEQDESEESESDEESDEEVLPERETEEEDIPLDDISGPRVRFRSPSPPILHQFETDFDIPMVRHQPSDSEEETESDENLFADEELQAEDSDVEAEAEDSEDEAESEDSDDEDEANDSDDSEDANGYTPAQRARLTKLWNEAERPLGLWRGASYGSDDDSSDSDDDEPRSSQYYGMPDKQRRRHKKAPSTRKDPSQSGDDVRLHSRTQGSLPLHSRSDNERPLLSQSDGKPRPLSQSDGKPRPLSQSDSTPRLLSQSDGKPRPLSQTDGKPEASQSRPNNVLVIGPRLILDQGSAEAPGATVNAGPIIVKSRPYGEMEVPPILFRRVNHQGPPLEEGDYNSEELLASGVNVDHPDPNGIMPQPIVASSDSSIASTMNATLQAALSVRDPTTGTKRALMSPLNWKQCAQVAEPLVSTSVFTVSLGRTVEMLSSSQAPPKAHDTQVPSLLDLATAGPSHSVQPASQDAGTCDRSATGRSTEGSVDSALRDEVEDEQDPSRSLDKGKSRAVEPKERPSRLDKGKGRAVESRDAPIEDPQTSRRSDRVRYKSPPPPQLFDSPPEARLRRLKQKSAQGDVQGMMEVVGSAFDRKTANDLALLDKMYRRARDEPGGCKYPTALADIQKEQKWFAKFDKCLCVLSEDHRNFINARKAGLAKHELLRRAKPSRPVVVIPTTRRRDDDDESSTDGSDAGSATHADDIVSGAGTASGAVEDHAEPPSDTDLHGYEPHGGNSLAQALQVILGHITTGPHAPVSDLEDESDPEEFDTAVTTGGRSQRRAQPGSSRSPTALRRRSNTAANRYQESEGEEEIEDDNEEDDADEDEDGDVEPASPIPAPPIVKRGPGRPKGSKNKSKDVDPASPAVDRRPASKNSNTLGPIVGTPRARSTAVASSPATATALPLPGPSHAAVAPSGAGPTALPEAPAEDVALPKKRGRPLGSKNKKTSVAASAAEESHVSVVIPPSTPAANTPAEGSSASASKKKATSKAPGAAAAKKTTSKAPSAAAAAKMAKSNAPNAAAPAKKKQVTVVLPPSTPPAAPPLPAPETPVDGSEPPKRKRGRPLGSKNKKTIAMLAATPAPATPTTRSSASTTQPTASTSQPIASTSQPTASTSQPTASTSQLPAPTTPAKNPVGRPRKHPLPPDAPKNPVGRPRKHPLPEGASAPPKKKSKANPEPPLTPRRSARETARIDYRDP